MGLRDREMSSAHMCECRKGHGYILFGEYYIHIVRAQNCVPGLNGTIEFRFY